MTTEQILKVLKNERECILSNHDNCYEKCRETCPYYVSGVEKMEVLDFLIKGYELTEIPITISREQADTLLELLKKSSLSVYPMPDEASYPTITVITPDEYGRQHFHGICPYTGKKCEKWTCNICEVEKRERKFMEGDND